MYKDAILKKIKNKNKDNAREWALVSKKNPKKILKWFGSKKPTEKQVLKEERRIHSFSSINNKHNDGDTKMLKELIQLANDLDKKGLTKDANALDVIITKLSNNVIDLEKFREKKQSDDESEITDKHYLIFDEEGKKPIRDAMIVIMSKKTKEDILSGNKDLKDSDADIELAFDVRELLEYFLGKKLED